MGKLYEGITPELITWVEQQHLFFVGTAPLCADGHVNCSPKGLDTLRILDSRHVAYLDLTGSGVPKFEYVEERDTLARWTEAKKIVGLPLYRKQHNARSIDGLPSLDPEE